MLTETRPGRPVVISRGRTRARPIVITLLAAALGTVLFSAAARPRPADANIDPKIAALLSPKPPDANQNPHANYIAPDANYVDVDPDAPPVEKGEVYWPLTGGEGELVAEEKTRERGIFGGGGLFGGGGTNGQCSSEAYAFCCGVGTTCVCGKGMSTPGQCGKAAWLYCCDVGTPCYCSLPGKKVLEQQEDRRREEEEERRRQEERERRRQEEWERNHRRPWTSGGYGGGGGGYTGGGGGYGYPQGGGGGYGGGGGGWGNADADGDGVPNYADAQPYGPPLAKGYGGQRYGRPGYAGPAQGWGGPGGPPGTGHSGPGGGAGWSGPRRPGSRPGGAAPVGFADDAPGRTGFADDEPGRGAAGGAPVTGDEYSDAMLGHVAHGDLGGIISTAADQAKTDPAGIQASQRLDDKLSKYDWTGVGHASTQGYIGAAQMAQGVFGRA